MALIGNWDWLLATFSHWQHCPLSSGQQYQPGQSLSWSPLYVPTRTTRLRAAPSAVFVCFPVFMRIAVYGLPFYHNGTGGANPANAG